MSHQEDRCIQVISYVCHVWLVYPHPLLLSSGRDGVTSMITKLPPLAVQMNKRGLRQAMNTDLASQLRYEALATAYSSDTEDHKEAIKAFREKREPVYKGR